MKWGVCITWACTRRIHIHAHKFWYMHLIPYSVEHQLYIYKKYKKVQLCPELYGHVQARHICFTERKARSSMFQLYKFNQWTVVRLQIFAHPFSYSHIHTGLWVHLRCSHQDSRCTIGEPMYTLAPLISLLVCAQEKTIVIAFTWEPRFYSSLSFYYSSLFFFFVYSSSSPSFSFSYFLSFFFFFFFFVVVIIIIINHHHQSSSSHGFSLYLLTRKYNTCLCVLMVVFTLYAIHFLLLKERIKILYQVQDMLSKGSERRYNSVFGLQSSLSYFLALPLVVSLLRSLTLFC